MSIKGIFGATFLTVVVALIIYDLLVKGFISKMFDKYDETFDPSGESVKQLRALAERTENKISKLAA